MKFRTNLATKNCKFRFLVKQDKNHLKFDAKKQNFR
jgi:hypothetical protein